MFLNKVFFPKRLLNQYLYIYEIYLNGSSRLSYKLGNILKKKTEQINHSHKLFETMKMRWKKSENAFRHSIHLSS